MKWGANAGEWDHFSRVLGLEADLLPVVSNPNAKISPDSRMKELGKTPSRYNSDGLVVGIPAWTRLTSTEAQVGRWCQQPDYGICLQTRNVRALDIDIADPAAAQRVLDYIGLCWSLPMRRRSGTGKCLLPVRISPGQALVKRILRTEHGAIEFLGSGQQFIAVGTHPSGSRYEWVSPEGEIALPERIPEMSLAEFEVLWSALVQAFGLPGGEAHDRRGIVPTKPRKLDDLRDPTVVWLEENGWLLEVERDGKAHIRCPFENEHTTHGNNTATTYFPAGVGGFAQGHFRCLHAHCAGRKDGDFIAALGLVAAEFEVVTAEDVADATAAAGEVVEQPLPPFQRDNRGAPLAMVSNLVMALTRPDLCGFRLAYDAFRDVPMVTDDQGTGWRPMTDADYVSMRVKLEARKFKPIGREVMTDAVKLALARNTIDSAQDWAAGLRWDGVPRIDTFWVDYFGVADSEYVRAVGAYTWTALAARCVEPGAKADMVPVLVGLQGAGKTTSVEALCPIPEAFVEINLDKKDEDIARSLRGKLVGEIAELRGLQSREAESIKAWVSRRFEEWVPKYREFSTRYGRRLLMIGTANNEEFLDDPTGERRWLPMTVGAVDVPGVRAVRDQLWAEGLERFRASGVEWQEAQRLAQGVHDRYKVSDSWQAPIEAWLARDEMDGGEGVARGVKPFQLHNVMVGALGFQVQRIGRKDELRVARVLRQMGYVKRNMRYGSEVRKQWVRADLYKEDEHAEFSSFADLA